VELLLNNSNIMKVSNNKYITEIKSKGLVDYFVIKPEYANDNKVIKTITELGIVPVVKHLDGYRHLNSTTKRFAESLIYSHSEESFQRAADRSNTHFELWAEAENYKYHIFKNPFTRVDACYIDNEGKLVLSEVKYIGKNSNLITKKGLILKQSKLLTLCSAHNIDCSSEYRTFGARNIAYIILDYSNYYIEEIYLAKTNFGDKTLVPTKITYLK
jgi:hypothetical protein